MTPPRSIVDVSFTPDSQPIPLLRFDTEILAFVSIGNAKSWETALPETGPKDRFWQKIVDAHLYLRMPGVPARALPAPVSVVVSVGSVRAFARVRGAAKKETRESVINTGAFASVVCRCAVLRNAQIGLKGRCSATELRP